ncbi:hypothetical protein N7535_006869 [Penicillium sp. DV-2018c]|nr:hypothetical protein N7535_006869 [Penicillium sp. DV-2018c]
MSGLEVVGVVAGILQLADIGAKLSVKLCTFYRTVKVANRSLQDLSSDVSLTCSILNELGKTLEQDDQARLCSKEAFSTAQDVLQECRAVFQQIETAIEKYDQDTEANRLRRGARKITAVFLGPNLDVLKSNLERLKTTTLLMLHVIIKAKSTLVDQRGLIQTLIEERRANDDKLNHLSKSLLSAGTNEDDSYHESSRSASSGQRLASLPRQLEEYYNLIWKLLCDIDSYQCSLEQSRHLRIRNGVVNVHSAEAVLFRDIYGHAAQQLFDDPFFKFKDPWLPPNGIGPGDSIFQTSRRPSDRSNDYSSDDSTVYIRKETREDDGDHVQHRRHLAEGSLVGHSAAELLRRQSHRKREGEEVSHGMSYSTKTADAGRLGAVAVNAAAHDRAYRRRHRSRGRHSQSRSRSRSRSHSHSRAKKLLELGVGASAISAGVAALRNKQDDEGKSSSGTRSCSRTRASSSASSDQANARSQSRHRKHMATAGVEGAAVAGLVERARSRSRSRKGDRERSHSRCRKTLPVVTGVDIAAATGIYEKQKAEKEGKHPASRERRRSRSRSSGSSVMCPDQSCDSGGLIEYGNDPVEGLIPPELYYGRPASPGAAYYSDGAGGYGLRHSRTPTMTGAPEGEGRAKETQIKKQGRMRSRSSERSEDTTDEYSMRLVRQRCEEFPSE